MLISVIQTIVFLGIETSLQSASTEGNVKCLAKGFVRKITIIVCRLEIYSLAWLNYQV